MMNEKLEQGAIFMSFAESSRENWQPFCLGGFCTCPSHFTEDILNMPQMLPWLPSHAVWTTTTQGENAIFRYGKNSYQHCN